MSYPTVFANLAAGNEPLSLFDTMFNIAGQQGNIPCTATGTNAITLTPSTNYYLPAAYTIAQIVSFKAAATSTGSVTLQIGGLSLLKLFTAAGVQCASGDIVSGTHYTIQYWADLDSNAGGFIILNATVTAIANPLQGAFKNLAISWTSNTTITPTADEIILQNASGGTVRLTTVAPAVTSTGSVGTANGIISAVSASTWYSFWFIYNPNAALSSTNPAGWLDTSATSPTPPAAYTYVGRFGWIRTNASSNIVNFIQKGKRTQYVVTTSTAAYPTTTAITATTMTAVSVTAQVPTATASEIYLTGNDSGASAFFSISPNASTSPTFSTTNPSPICSQATGTSGNATGSFLLESTNIFGATNSGTLNIFVLGWQDNL